ncbi:hypothetical protein QWY86_05370 [Pedobacter aquatilis]|uniref:hypothetical protein n=1 Tax=Pedobacter aquatilis TaxID=351343 RepID=UPI0025B5B6AD|nr:hypothetical protein [Pedobacter aquatilis]MDN3586086.1 hypothetical protein [Pedobacter aquatilis]
MPAGQAKQDAIIGAFLANFETGRHVERIKNQLWQWNVDYFKFRGRGKGAFESVHGSDGIFQIIVKDKFNNTIFQKGLLFQAKKVNGSFSDLKPQVRKMETLSPLSSVAFIYGPNGFKATKGTDILHNDITQKNSFLFEHDIATILAEDFINCTIGKIDLTFDAEQGKLFLVDTFGQKKRIIGLQRPSDDVEIKSSK